MVIKEIRWKQKQSFSENNGRLIDKGGIVFRQLESLDIESILWAFIKSRNMGKN